MSVEVRGAFVRIIDNLGVERWIDASAVFWAERSNAGTCLVVSCGSGSPAEHIQTEASLPSVLDALNLALGEDPTTKHHVYGQGPYRE